MNRAPLPARARVRPPPWVAYALLATCLAGLTGVLRAPDRIWSLSFTGDGATGPWFHSFLAHAVALGSWPDRLGDFNHPSPLYRPEAFATVTDALLLAPLEILPWPERWGATLTAVVLLNALGVTLLARASGVGAVGAAAAGLLAAVLPPPWQEMAEGRTNTMLAGLPPLALAALLRSTTPVGPRDPTAWRLAPVAGLLTAVAGLVYPPWLVLWAPVGLLLAAERRWRTGAHDGPRPPWHPGPMALAGWVTVVIAGPALWDLWMHPASHHVPSPLPGCADPGEVVALQDLVTTGVPAAGLRFAFLPVMAWIAALPALAGRRRRASAALLAVAALLAGLSAGPCALLTREPVVHLAQASPLLPSLFALADRLHDLDRLLGPAGLVVALVAGRGIDDLLPVMVRGRPLLRPLAVGAILLALTGIATSARVLSTAASAPTLRVPWGPLVTARYLCAAPPGAAAELPWDQGAQFRSAIACHRPRMNPLRRSDRYRGTDPLLSWLDALGRGESSPPPRPEDLREPAVRYVFHDPSRCGGTRTPVAACGSEVRATLTAVLGPPQTLEREVLAWDLLAPRPPSR